MILELHCHTREHSACSHIAAADLVQSNFDRGLQGTVLTDHQYLWSTAEIDELRSRLRVPEYYLILSGQEVETRELGHVLVYGADVSLERGISIKEIRERWPGAALVWAHPYRDERIPAPDDHFHPLINAIEVFNSNHTVAENNRGLRDWHRYKFTAVSGSDTHALSYTALYPTTFDHPFATIHELAAEIRSGRCRPYFREIQHSGTSDTQVLEVELGAPRNKTEGTEKIIVRSHKNKTAWTSAARATHITEEIRRHGFEQGRFRVPRQFGSDRESLTVIEQAFHGSTLFDKIVEGSRDEARNCLALAAEWLARLHNAGLRITPPGEFLHEEPNRLEYYVSAFYKVNHRHGRRAREIMDSVIDTETALYCTNQNEMVQGHGDFHPKNIFIGHDRTGDPGTLFVAAIDFNSSSVMPPAFDVGTFLAQYRNQFYGNKQVLSKAPEQLFIESYLRHAARIENDFFPKVELFMARTALSICYHLIKVGLGDSENLWRVLVEAGNILARLSFRGLGTASSEQREKKRKSA